MEGEFGAGMILILVITFIVIVGGTLIDEYDRDQYVKMGVPPLVAACEADYEPIYEVVCKEAKEEFYKE